jgi:hypothetical protein
LLQLDAGTKWVEINQDVEIEKDMHTAFRSRRNLGAESEATKSKRKSVSRYYQHVDDDTNYQLCGSKCRLVERPSTGGSIYLLWRKD